MADVLEVYRHPYDPRRPVVCLDETSKQLIAETRVPTQMKPGRPARSDYEYARNGTANLFMMLAPLDGWRHVEVTDRHASSPLGPPRRRRRRRAGSCPRVFLTAVDHAQVSKDRAYIHFSDAEKIALAQDDPNTHTKATAAFPTRSRFEPRARPGSPTTIRAEPRQAGASPQPMHGSSSSTSTLFQSDESSQ
jgi:hypothetical protein